MKFVGRHRVLFCDKRGAQRVWKGGDRWAARGVGCGSAGNVAGEVRLAIRLACPPARLHDVPSACPRG